MINPNKSNNDKKLATPEEAADILGVSPGTLSVWRSTGRTSLRYVKIGRKVMYRRSDVDNFIQNNLHNHTSSLVKQEVDHGY